MKSLKDKQSEDKCIICSKKSGYMLDTPINEREYYIETAGQLCPKCYYDTYTDVHTAPYKLSIGKKIYCVFKSVIDFLIALIALIILAPLFLVVAAAIKIDSPGPVFFVQKRIGKNGKIFNCIKFRSMSVTAKHDVAGYEYANASSYITKTGAFIRKFSIDELPQLFNILTFKMNLIGYRPSQPCEKELNDERNRYNVHLINPGISGWAQVNGRDVLASNPKKKAKFDAYYLQNLSLLLDIKIFFMTIAKIFKCEDIAEGVINNNNEFTPENEKDMLVSIITVSFNSSETISKTIERVFNQTYGNIEYIIIDGASDDETLNIAKSYQRTFDNTPGRALKIISEPDNGMYDALNKGIKIAGGEIIGNINSDDWYEYDAVEKMVSFYKKENYDVAWGDLRIIKDGGNIIKKAKLGKFWTTTGWCHPSMFAKKKILTEFPYACETMYDDFDFVTRVKLAGRKISVLNQTIANFKIGGMSTKKSLREVKKRIDITYSIYRKHGMSRLYYLHRIAVELFKYIFQ